MKEEKFLCEYDQKKYVAICDLLLRIWIVAVISLWLVHWVYGIGAVAFGVWSFLWYEQGKMSQVVDEWEQDGYPQDGFRWMVKSWIFLLIIVIIGCFCFK